MQTSDLYDSVTKSIIADLEKGGCHGSSRGKAEMAAGSCRLTRQPTATTPASMYSFCGPRATSTVIPRRSG